MPDEAVDLNKYRNAWRKSNPVKCRAQEKRHREKYPEKDKAKKREYYLRNRERLLKSAKTYGDANRERYRDQRLQRDYGISLTEYLAMYAKQDGRCGCCNAPRPSSGKKGMAVDHNHKTGEIRALLCMACNVSIGHLGESDLRAHAIADYLDRWTR